MVLPPAGDEEYYTRETRDVAPAHLLTKIKSFSMLSDHKIPVIESTEFEAGDYKWNVRINLEKGDHISVNLCMAGTNSLPAGWEVYAMFNFFLYNHISDKYLCFRGKARRFHAINPQCVFSNLITKESLKEPSNGYIFNDKCVFGAEVFVIKRPLIERVYVHQLTNPFKRKWKISRFSKLQRVWKSEEFSVGGYKWKIKIDPNGSGAKTGGRYLSIFLECVDAKSFGRAKKVNAACLFRLKNKFGDEDDRSLEVIDWFTSATPGWGSNQFIAVDDMLDPSEGFVVDDCCNLEIQLSVQSTLHCKNMMT